MNMSLLRLMFSMNDDDIDACKMQCQTADTASCVTAVRVSHYQIPGYTRNKPGNQNRAQTADSTSTSTFLTTP